MEERDRRSGSSGGRAGAAEIAWEEGSRRGKPVKSRVANFSEKKKGFYF